MRYQWIEYSSEKERLVYDTEGNYIISYYYCNYTEIWDDNIPLRSLFYRIPRQTLRLPLYKFKKIVIIYTSGIIL